MWRDLIFESTGKRRFEIGLNQISYQSRSFSVGYGRSLTENLEWHIERVRYAIGIEQIGDHQLKESLIK